MSKLVGTQISIQITATNICRRCFSHFHKELKLNKQMNTELQKAIQPIMPDKNK